MDKIFAYTVCGFMCGVAGLLMLGRMGSANTGAVFLPAAILDSYQHGSSTLGRHVRKEA